MSLMVYLFVVDKYTIRLEVVRIVQLGIIFFIYKLMCYLFYKFYGEEISINIDLNREHSYFSLFQTLGFFKCNKFNVYNLVFSFCLYII